MRAVLLSTALCASLLLSGCSRKEAVPEVKPPQTKEQAIEAFRLSHQAEIATMAESLESRLAYAMTNDPERIVLSKDVCIFYEDYLSDTDENNAEIFSFNKQHPDYQVKYQPLMITTQFITLCDVLKKVDAPK